MHSSLVVPSPLQTAGASTGVPISRQVTRFGQFLKTQVHDGKDQ